ncbi:GlxA family transcriptional regulator [Stenotrophomonas lactitubi]|uniref:GlxA family transcriptional regulator n=1 Tax=Stenotrophomonas lactitubi TaxID=2045214 RepID=UPI0033405C88
MCTKLQNQDPGHVRDIAFLVFPEFQIQDLAGPLAAFETASGLAGEPAYRCQVVSADGGGVRSSAGLEVVTSVIQPEPYDTLVVAGSVVSSGSLKFPTMNVPLRAAADNGTRRIASVCTGAFALAAAGLLDGRRATTHWRHALQLQREFPRVKVDGERIFTKDGDRWTSAGITAGIDLALAMIEEDLGAELARATAQMLVVYHRRTGNQSQFSALSDMEPESDRIRDVLTYMREHLHESLSTERLASVACLSPRQFGRAFLADTGETPAKAVERLRVEVALQLVERAGEPIELIAHRVGFTDPERMRRAFLRVVGHPPQSVRRMAMREAGVAA